MPPPTRPVRSGAEARGSLGGRGTVGGGSIGVIGRFIAGIAAVACSEGVSSSERGGAGGSGSA